MKSEFVENFVSLVPIYGAAFILIGVLHYQAYYSLFNIDIFTYLDLSEYITGFFKTGVFVWMLFLMLLILNIRIIKNRSKNPQYSGMWFLIIFYTIFSAYLLAYELVNALTYSFKKCFFPYLTVFFAGFLTLFAIRRLEKYIDFYINPHHFASLLILLFTTYQIGLVLGNNVNHKKRGIIFTTKDEKKISIDSTSFFVGKTLNYIFLYNIKSDSVTVYPIDKLESYTLFNRTPRE